MIAPSLSGATQMEIDPGAWPRISAQLEAQGVAPKATDASIGFFESAKLVAADGEFNDWFSVSVAVSGDTVAVGAHYNGVSGAAYVFDRDHGGAGNWGQVKKLTPVSPEANTEFGVSIAVSGDTVVVGARHASGNAIESGIAYVFERDHGGTDNWGIVAALAAYPGTGFGLFGSSVAIGENTIVVGAPRDATLGSHQGAVYVYDRNSIFASPARLVVQDGLPEDFFGVSVATSGETIVAGAPGDDDHGSSSGSVYIFDRIQGVVWILVDKIFASDAGEGDRFGRSVTISGDTVIVAEPGAAYVFDRDQGGADNWGQARRLTPSDGTAGDFFGSSIALSGDTLIVGAKYDDHNGAESGAAYVFDRDQGGADSWGQTTKLTPSDSTAGDYFGWKVALSGDTFVVGALSDENYADSGSAYVFERAVIPVVALVGTTPDTGDGMLSADEWSSAAISGFDVRFTVAMTTSGTGSVTSADNWQLVAAGADGEVTPASCLTGPAGDDSDVPLGALSYDVGAMIASFVPESGFLADGSHRLMACASLRSLDNAPLDGNGDGLAGDDFVLPFGVDTQKPFNPTLSSPSHVPAAWSADASVDILWSGASDAASGVAGYSVRVDATPTGIPDDSADIGHTGDPHAATIGPLADGTTWYFHLRTCDAVGHCADPVHLGPFFIDATAPSAPGAVVSSSHGYTPTADPSIDVAWGAATDAGAGLDHYRYGFTTFPVTNCSVLSVISSGLSATSADLEDGAWFAHVCAEDALGNVGPVSTGGPFVVDTTPPTGLSGLPISHETSTWSADASVSTVFFGADDTNGVAGYSFSFDETAGAEPDTVMDNTNGVFTGTASAGGDSWWAHGRACDGAGNCGDTVHLGPFWVDTVAPSDPTDVTSSSHAVGEPSADGMLAVHWAAAVDALSGVAGYAWAFDEDPSWTCDGSVDGSATAATSHSLGSGQWYFHVCAVDVAGNPSGVADLGPFVIDRTGPTVSAVSAVAATADGIVSTDEPIRAPVTRLVFTFDEAMGPTPLDNAANWLMVEAGADGTVETVDCGPVVDSDTEVVLSNTWGLDETTAAIWPGGNFALPMGAYAVLACDGLTDALGNPLSPVFQRRFEITVDTLSANPNFDDDAREWWLVGRGGVAWIWDAAGDIDGSPASGGLQLSATGAGDATATQCLDLELGGSLFIDLGVAISGASFFDITARYTADENCVNLDPAAYSLLSITGPTDGWQRLTGRVVLPAAPGSVELSIITTVTTAGQTVHFDRIAVDEVTLFTDGFESGTTTPWSEVVE